MKQKREMRDRIATVNYTNIRGKLNNLSNIYDGPLLPKL